MAELKDARKRSVDNLQRIYTFVVSLAVTESLRRTLLAPDNTVLLVWSNKWLMLISLNVTVVPFYHGANRYLDATYVTEERAAKHVALMIDFFDLFFQGIWMFGLSLFVNNPDYHPFYTGLAILLLIDAAWVFFTKLVEVKASATQNATKYYAWAFINIIAAILILIFVWSRFWPGDAEKNNALVTLAILRSILDYALGYSFYHPPDPPPQATAAVE